MIIPVLLLASAAQPVYRFGAFIETTHDSRSATLKIEGTGGIDPDRPTEEDAPAPEPSWPVELVALFPASIGSCEQAFRAPVGGRPLLDAEKGSTAFCPSFVSTAGRFTRLVLGERSATVLIAVVAHPIHIHAPPPVL